MTGLAEQLKRLGQLSRNVRDASLRLEAIDPRSLFAAEVAEFCECTVAIVGGLALDVLPVQLAREEGAPRAPMPDPEAQTKRIPRLTDEELEAELLQHAGEYGT